MNVSIIALILIIITSGYVMTFVNNANAIAIEVRDQEGRLVISSLEPTKNSNLFEPGVWALPILTANLIFLFLVILNYKKGLPVTIKKSIKFIFEYEVSRKVALIIVVSLIAIYVIFNVGKIWDSEEESWGDYEKAVSQAKNWSAFSSISLSLGSDLRIFLLSISLNIFGNIRIIPFIVSISLLVMTYFLAAELSKKRFAGIISTVILLQSNLFLRYSVSATEDNTWTLFYILSLYLVYKKWFLSPLAYGLSFLSKPLTAIFLPMTFFFIYTSSLSKKEKARTALLYITTILIPVVIAIYLYRGTSFDPNGFWTGLIAFQIFLRFDGLILVLLLPLAIGLFVASKKGILHADSLMILITGILWSAPLLAGFAEITNQAYRFVPLIVFFAIGFSILFSNNMNKQLVTKNFVTTLVSLFTIVTAFVSVILVIFPNLIQIIYKLF